MPPTSSPYVTASHNIADHFKHRSVLLLFYPCTDNLY